MIMWQRLGAALEYYSGLGFQYLDVPWIVGQAAMDETCPPGYALRVTRDSVADPAELGYLVGSGEQGFIELLFAGKLPVGDSFMTVSPCFRTEEKYDGVFQLPWFMKLELFSWTLKPSEVMMMARKFYQRWYHPVDLVEFRQAMDLRIHGVEVGSYGLRKLEDGRVFTYGTGLAEPRFTNIKGNL